MITRKDLREDVAKGIDKPASLHLLRSKQLTQWQRIHLRSIHEMDLDLRFFVPSGKAGL